LVPLAATIFFFLLFANWLELIPGVDSIGLIHCAHEDMPGFETKDGPLGMRQIVVPEPLYKGVDDGAPATEEAYEACKAHHDGEESPDHAEGGAAVATEGSEAASTEETGTGGEGEENTEAAAATTEGEGGEAHAEGETKYKEIVTPFIRAAATDLNLTFALAVIAVVVIQYMGVSELGWGYPAKFINTPALEKGDVMSFGVGWLELISEISKIISFAFRLFGNIFAGQILLFVIPFLVATMLPTAVYGLEIAVHVIQATVFAMLFMVFASIAMAGHGDEHEHH
jgi:F-type H+-transporting ATPase subunit a